MQTQLIRAPLRDSWRPRPPMRLSKYGVCSVRLMFVEENRDPYQGLI